MISMCTSPCSDTSAAAAGEEDDGIGPVPTAVDPATAAMHAPADAIAAASTAEPSTELDR